MSITPQTQRRRRALSRETMLSRDLENARTRALEHERNIHSMRAAFAQARRAARRGSDAIEALVDSLREERARARDAWALVKSLSITSQRARRAALRARTAHSATPRTPAAES